MQLVLYRGRVRGLHAAIGCADSDLLERTATALEDMLADHSAASIARVQAVAMRIIMKGEIYTERSPSDDVNRVLAALVELSPDCTPLGGKLRASTLWALAEALDHEPDLAALARALHLLATGRRLDAQRSAEVVGVRATCGYLTSAELPPLISDMRSLLTLGRYPALHGVMAQDDTYDSLTQLLAAATQGARDQVDMLAFGT